MGFDADSFNNRDRNSFRGRVGQSVVSDEARKASLRNSQDSGEEKPFKEVFIDHKWDAENCLPGQRRYRNRMARQGQGLNHVGDDAVE